MSSLQLLYTHHQHLQYPPYQRVNTHLPPPPTPGSPEDEQQTGIRASQYVNFKCLKNNPLSHRPRHIGQRNPQSHPPVVRPPPARSTLAARPSPPVRASPALPPAGAVLLYQ
jgi:hypothetical protein